MTNQKDLPKRLLATRSLVTGGSDAAPPAHFLSLTVDNVRCFKGRETLNLSTEDKQPARWTILLGDNGVGKTTLLQCIAGIQPVLFTVFSAAGDLPLVPRLFAHPFTHGNAQLVHAGQFLGTITSVFTTGKKISDVLPIENATSVSFTFDKDGTGRTDNFELGAGNLLCYGYGASRRLTGTGLGEDTTHSDACASLFDEDAALTNAEEWLLRADYTHLKFNDTDASKRFQAVKGVLAEILPGVANVRTIQPENLSRPPLVEVNHEGIWVPLRALSSGYRSVLVWMVDLVTRLFERYPKSGNPLAEPAIVLVDQIDLHLHPRWQRELIGHLSRIFKNTQFIVTAHSPLIVQAAAAVGANIAVLKREGDHVRILQDIESVRGWSVEQILASELFDEQPGWDEITENKLKERRELLAKSKLTPLENAHLKRLDAEIGPLPGGRSSKDIEAWSIIHEAAERLRQQQTVEKPRKKRPVKT